MALDIRLEGGFAAPVLAAQSSFRSLMDAMARPGSRAQLTAEATAPAGLGPAQAALALTLADAETPVWLSPALRSEDLRLWLAFHSGAPVTDTPADCAFAFLGRGEAIPEDLPLGSQDYPDRSATVIAEVEGLDGGDRLTLAGPGIDGTREIAVCGLPPGLVARLAGNRALFPRGIDLVLTAGRTLVALPRSTRIIGQGA